MVAVWMMKPAVDEVIDVVAMWDPLVTAPGTMRVRAVDFRGTFNGICGVYRDRMLIDMILVHVVKVAVVEIIDVAVVADRNMPAARAVPMRMVGMLRLGASCHCIPPFELKRRRRGATIARYDARQESISARVASFDRRRRGQR